jgi:hypothetical protein
MTMGVQMNVSAEGDFLKKRLFRDAKHGRYRGAGSIVVHENGIKVIGKHVHPLWKRWMFALVLLLIWLFLVISKVFVVAPGFLLALIFVYVTVEYYWLKREDLQIPFSAITGVAVDERRKLIGVKFEGHGQCSPAILRSPDFKPVADAMNAAARGNQIGKRKADSLLSP